MLRWTVDVEAYREVAFLFVAAAFQWYVLPGRVNHENVAVTAGLQYATLRLEGRCEGMDASTTVYKLPICSEEQDREAGRLVPIRVALLLVCCQSSALLVHRDG